ncbi:MAG: hypothetical protein ACJ8DC_16340 [Gemmatimonadales bacterium]
MSDHLHRLRRVYDDRFARECGPWRPVVAQVADKLLACGVLEHDFARIRRDACAHEYLLAFPLPTIPKRLRADRRIAAAAQVLDHASFAGSMLIRS